MSGKVLAGGAVATILALGVIGGGAAIASSGSSDDSSRDGFRDSVERSTERTTEREFETESRDDGSFASLAQRASLTPAEAEQAALQAQPGQVTKVELEEEEGFAVYQVEIAGARNVEHELDVDARNGNILDSETDIEDDDHDDRDDEYDDRDDREDEWEDRYDD